jgi:hypothetical protein
MPFPRGNTLQPLWNDTASRPTMLFLMMKNSDFKAKNA